MNLRIVLADDHQMFRDALRGLIEKQSTNTIVGDTGDGSALLELVRATAPDIVIMDIGMPGLNGIDATRQLLAACPQVRVIALSAHGEKRYITEMIQAGAKGYVIKAAAADTLMHAIRVVANNEIYLAPEVAAAVVDVVRGGEPGELSRLGKREREVLRLVAEGKSSPQIAALLNIAPSTVDVHRRNIKRKLNLHTVADLTKWAVQHDLTSL
jgi:DNA-binding NarL/FixJ family response regulator